MCADLSAQLGYGKSMLVVQWYDMKQKFSNVRLALLTTITSKPCHTPCYTMCYIMLHTVLHTISYIVIHMLYTVLYIMSHTVLYIMLHVLHIMLHIMFHIMFHTALHIMLHTNTTSHCCHNHVAIHATITLHLLLCLSTINCFFLCSLMLSW